MFYYEIVAVYSGKMADLGTSDSGITKVLLDVPKTQFEAEGGISSRVFAQHAQALGSILRTKVEKFPNPI